MVNKRGKGNQIVWICQEKYKHQCRGTADKNEHKKIKTEAPHSLTANKFCHHSGKRDDYH